MANANALQTIQAPVRVVTTIATMLASESKSEWTPPGQNGAVNSQPGVKTQSEIAGKM
jgi:hypothetical protein